MARIVYPVSHSFEHFKWLDQLHFCPLTTIFVCNYLCHNAQNWVFAWPLSNAQTIILKHVTHTLSCSIDGLVIARHNKIRDKLLYLSQRAFTSASVCTKPIIHKGRTRSELEIRQSNDKHKDTRGGCDDPRVMGSSSRRHHLRQARWRWHVYIQVRANDITPGQVEKYQERQAR